MRFNRAMGRWKVTAVSSPFGRLSLRIRVKARHMDNHRLGLNSLVAGIATTCACRLGLNSLVAGIATTCACAFTFFSLCTIASAQFTVVGPAPFPPTVARQKIKTLLEKADSSNTGETLDALSAMLAWYRDILDEEMVAAWGRDGRTNLPPIMKTLADSRVASGVVEFSWHAGRQAAFTPGYAPMLGDLMARYPASAKPFLDDLLRSASSGQPMPDLSQAEVQTVCRILLDMPDVGSWRDDALKILPYYGRVVESILIQEREGGDQEESWRAQRWLADLRFESPNPAAEQQTSRRSSPSILSPTEDSPSPIRHIARQPDPVAVPERPLAYNGPQSGTLECKGAPIPQNAEYVFRGVPLGKIQLDYDSKTWDARLTSGDGQTQRLILRNKSSGPQKRCIVHWSITP
jgi:hypothetical protein